MFSAPLDKSLSTSIEVAMYFSSKDVRNISQLFKLTFPLREDERLQTNVLELVRSFSLFCDSA